jgi:hypothetical protein
MALNKPGIICRKYPQTGQLVVPICWDDEWVLLPIFAIVASNAHICMWRRGWRRVAGFLREETGDGE